MISRKISNYREILESTNFHLPTSRDLERSRLDLLENSELDLRSPVGLKALLP